MDQEIINKTVAGLTTADTHGILSVRGINEFILVSFDSNKAKNEGDFIALPTSAFFLINTLDKKSRSIKPLSAETKKYASDTAGLGMVGRVPNPNKDKYTFIDYDLRVSGERDIADIFPINTLESNIGEPSDGVTVTISNNTLSERREILVASDSKSLIKATELRYLLSISHKYLHNSKFRTYSNEAGTKATAVLEYVAVEFLRQSTESVPNSNEIENIVRESCGELGVDKKTVDQALQRHNERTGQNAEKLLTDVWRQADEVNFDSITNSTRDSIPTGYDPDTTEDDSQPSEQDTDRDQITERIDQLEDEFETFRESSKNSQDELIDQLEYLRNELVTRHNNLGEQVDGLREDSEAADEDLQNQIDNLQTVLSQLGATTDSQPPVRSTDSPDDHLDTPWRPPTALDISEPFALGDTDLHFPDSLSGTDNLADRIHAALVGGKHLILTGPPGSGKTTLADDICDHYAPSHELTTATNDWRTFDTVGGYRQRDDGSLEFAPGVFLQCWGDPEPDTLEGGDGDASDADSGDGDDTDEIAGRNSWLVVDELNRADADQAFGSLFTVLTGETVTLPFDTPGGDPITVVGDPAEYDGAHVDHDGDSVPEARRSHYFVPPSWRMVATANSADKATLYRLSYAFMRRFAFVHVPAPGQATLTDDGGDPDPDVVEPYFDCWVDSWRVDFEDVAEQLLDREIDPSAVDGFEPDDDTDEETVADKLRAVVAEHLAEIWVAASGSRDIGPGIVADLAEQTVVRLAESGQLTYDHAVAGTLLPQFENRRQDLRGFLEGLDGVPGFEAVGDGEPESATAVLAADYLDADLPGGDRDGS